MIKLFNRLRSLATEPLPIPKGSAVNFHVTLWPAFDHFARFAVDRRIQGIRLNSAMMAASEIDNKFVLAAHNTTVPLWFDIKGMQLRIKDVPFPDQENLVIDLTRPIKCKTPCAVWFKGGEDTANCVEIQNGGTRLVFDRWPRYMVKPGESIHIRNPELEVEGEVLLDYELEKIQKIKAVGIKRWYLSYVYDQRHVDAFREVIGDDELILKIENQAGLKYVATQYRPMPNTRLAAARGDLYVEVTQPHDILRAVKLIIERDPQAIVGSRMLLSLVKGDVPSCADFSELAWLYDIGYRNFLLCDELCLKEHMLGAAVNTFDAFRKDYVRA